jgi:hypothetical protein
MEGSDQGVILGLSRATETFNEDDRTLERDLNPGLSAQETRVATTEPTLPVDRTETNGTCRWSGHSDPLSV